MSKLYAQPFDISAEGFYFDDFKSYSQNANSLRNSYGQRVEEFELHWIDGETIDMELFNALSVHQGNIDAFFKACEDWEEYQKINVIIAVGEVGYNFDLHESNPDDFEIDLYEMDTLKDLAYQFLDEGLFGDFPENLHPYLDYDAIAIDLRMDYSETRIAGTNYVYRCD